MPSETTIESVRLVLEAVRLKGGALRSADAKFLVALVARFAIYPECVDGDTSEKETAFIRIIQVAARMRQLQSRYFATRDRVVLAEAKGVEQELDRLIADLATKQGKLF